MSNTPIDFKQFRVDMMAAVAELEAKYAMKISLGNIRYDATSFNCKLTGTFGATDAKDVRLAKYKKNYERNAFFLKNAGIEIGKQFSFGELLIVVGMASNRSNSKVCLQTPSGEVKLGPQEMVAKMLSK